VKDKSLHCPQLDGLAGQKTWKTTQTTMRGYKYAIYTRVVRKIRFPIIFHNEKHVYWH
jgi:hypothetical protein